MPGVKSDPVHGGPLEMAKPHLSVSKYLLPVSERTFKDKATLQKHPSPFDVPNSWGSNGCLCCAPPSPIDYVRQRALCSK